MIASLNLVFAREQAPAIFDELPHLIEQHYVEIAVDMGQSLDPDWDQYRLQEAAGALRVYTAREEGVLVGYAVFFLRPHQHSKNSVQAVADLLYIHPSRRGCGNVFIKWCDEQLKSDGAQVVYHRVTPYFDFSAMLTRMGYEPVESVYARRL